MRQELQERSPEALNILRYLVYCKIVQGPQVLLARPAAWAADVTKPCYLQDLTCPHANWFVELSLSEVVRNRLNIV